MSCWLKYMCLNDLVGASTLVFMTGLFTWFYMDWPWAFGSFPSCQETFTAMVCSAWSILQHVILWSQSNTHKWLSLWSSPDMEEVLRFSLWGKCWETNNLFLFLCLNSTTLCIHDLQNVPDAFVKKKWHHLWSCLFFKSPLLQLDKWPLGTLQMKSKFHNGWWLLENSIYFLLPPFFPLPLLAFRSQLLHSSDMKGSPMIPIDLS